MFTGIIEEKGTVQAVTHLAGDRSIRLTVGARTVLSDVSLGASIAVNGVCLTVVAYGADWFAADVMPETWTKTSLGRLQPNDPVNLERTMPAGGRFGGHVVQGHVDGVGTLSEIIPDEIALRLHIMPPADLLRYIVPKGSVALDGISLTVVDVTDHDFSVSIIPHTLQVTNLGHRRVGDVLNIEVDILGKYVEKLLAGRLSGHP
jgi:riboflavin synthase